MPTVSQYRADVDELTRLAGSDLAALWRQITTAAVAEELLADILPALVDIYGTAAATLAADWYDDLRIEDDIPGRFTAITAELPPTSRTNALAGWVASTFTDDPDTALTNAQGGLQRIIADAGRQTISGSSIEDPKARGWQRSASGGCGFCRMLASRGAVYTKATVDFGSHDHCRCVAVPAWNGKAFKVKPYTPSAREVTAADRARTLEWMAENGY